MEFQGERELYNLPTNFDGRFLVGKKLELICFGAHQIYFHFSSDILITVESAYSCRQKSEAASGRIRLPVSQSDLMKLLERAVIRVIGDSTGTLIIEFDDGNLLAFYDTSEQHESYSIKNGDQTIIV